MAKGRNAATERSVLHAAWDLFCACGVDKTSYTELAERSGVSRPLVQRYFPKKDLLVEECVRRIRQESVAVGDACVACAMPGTPPSPLGLLYARGQVNVAAYFADEGVRRLMCGVFASQSLPQQTIAEGLRWTMHEVLPERVLPDQVDEPDEIIMAMGGMYELIYTYLRKNTELDIPRCIRPSILLLGELYGVDCVQGELEELTFEPQALGNLGRAAIERTRLSFSGEVGE